MQRTKSVARQRLGFGAHLGCEAAMTVDVGAHRREPGFGIETRRQFGQRHDGVLMRAIGFSAVGIEAAVPRKTTSRSIALQSLPLRGNNLGATGGEPHFRGRGPAKTAIAAASMVPACSTTRGIARCRLGSSGWPTRCRVGGW